MKQTCKSNSSFPNRALTQNEHRLEVFNNSNSIFNNQNSLDRVNEELSSDYSGLPDFCNISILPSGPIRIQTKLRINTPRDRYEQEAERVAEQVMRMPAKTIQRKCEKCGKEDAIQRTPMISVQRTCANCEEEEEMLQTKPRGNLTNMASPALINQIQNTRGGGQVMDTSTRSFMEPRFGNDFSGVRIHVDSQSAKMNQEINARAFTIGSDIYFNRGAYSPGSVEGKKLLAHELTHVVQQRSDKIQRKISYKTPTPVEKDPLLLVLGGKKLGKTYASFNGAALPDGSMTGARQLIGKTLIPTKLTFTKNGSTFTAKANTNDINVTTSAIMETITQPNNNVWTGVAPPLPVPGNFSSQCRNVKSISVEMRGFPNLHATVITHENEHWADIKSLTTSEIKPAHDLILGLTGSGNSQQNAQSDWDTKLNGITSDIISKIDNFLTKLIAANKVYDEPGRGTHFTETKVSTDQTCSKISIKP